MKKYKSLIILLAVLVVLVVAYVVTGQLKKKSAEKENEEKQIAVLDMSDITSIQYTNGTDTMSFIKEECTWYSESDKEFPLQQSLSLIHIYLPEHILACLRKMEAVRSKSFK